MEQNRQKEKEKQLERNMNETDRKTQIQTNRDISVCWWHRIKNNQRKDREQNTRRNIKRAREKERKR